ncbi:MAG: hypothetical protein JXR29_12270, partial [Methylothermaceae bacterium]|nr:hypothetical protein [Methylothermaceae bacterium]
MIKQTLIVAGLTVGLSLSVGSTPVQAQEEPIYGSQLMTEQERIEMRAKMRAAESAEERERIRKEHHEQLQQRAKEQGVTLPDEPPARGKGGMGQGKGGMGQGKGGMGQGQGGMGQGKGGMGQ